MRIGILCHASFGGSARVATELAIGLAQRQHQVHLFSRTVPFGQWIQSTGVKVHTVVPEWANGEHPACLITNWPSEDLDIFIAQVVRIVAREKIEVLHFHYEVPFARAALMIQRRLGTQAPAIVGTLHGTDVSVYGCDPQIGSYLAKILPKMAALTTVSNNYAQFSQNVFQLPKPPQVIYNYVDLSRFRPQENRILGISHTKPRLVHVSNFRPVKNAPSMARIFVGIRQQMAAELWLIGDGPDMDQVRAIFKENGIEQDVHYWGLQREVAPLLAQTDLMLLTSLNESFSLVALEAMACGVPVVSTNVGGLPEVVLDGITGGHFNPGDEARATKRRGDILTNPPRQRQMGGAARRHAQTFDRAAIISQYETLYRTQRLERVQTGMMTYIQRQPAFSGVGRVIAM